jgi:transcription-repair coupling factor (superfamily II helicase)
MREDVLEKIMLRFVKKEFDVLVSTTIIESGLDIPNANTIIILRADQLGLAQLYQLRGRVGRSNKQAYAYLIVPEAKKLTEEARSRLSVLQSLDDLGLGFNLAARDLEIRGAGNLLGKDQSGNVQTVGLDMFNRILKEAILNMRGEELPIIEAIDPEMRIPVDAYIPPNYVPDLSERLILYQRLADLITDDSAWELSDEIEDRFGVMPKPVQHLLQLMRLRSLIRLGGVVRIEFSSQTIILHFTPRAPIDRDRLSATLANNKERYAQKSPLSYTIKVDLEILDNPADLVEPVKHFLNLIIHNFPAW